MNMLRCSVVVPSYNRQAMLDKVLQGLERQTLPGSQFEVIVVLDGTTDGSPAMLTTWEQSGRITNLRWHLQPNSGQAMARNRGVQMARSPLIVFLDDDVVPEPDTLERHLRWHERGERIAVLGDCRIVVTAHDSLYQRSIWAWWEDLYHERTQPGRQPNYRDFCAGNVSLRREDLLAIGGFDSGFRNYGGEDYELGYRLLRAGVQFVADRTIKAGHYHRVATSGILRGARHEAHGDVHMARLHPQLMPGLRFMHIPGGIDGKLARMAINQPQFGDHVIGLGIQALKQLERFHMQNHWIRIYRHLRTYAYWRGLRDLFPGWQALNAFRASAPAEPEQTLDISQGLPAQLPPLWVDGPSRLKVVYQGQEVGIVHLRESITRPTHAYLAEQIVAQLGVALWLSSNTPTANDLPGTLKENNDARTSKSHRDRAERTAA